MDHGRTSTDLARGATLPAAAVPAELATEAGGLTGAQAAQRLRETGPNALRSHGARPLAVLARQLIELGKRRFYRLSVAGPTLSRRRPPRERPVHHYGNRNAAATTVGG